MEGLLLQLSNHRAQPPWFKTFKSHCDSRNNDSSYPSYLKPPVRELQGDEERKFKRRLYWNRIFYAMFPMMRTVLLRSQQLFLKFGPRVRLTEAVTSEFIAKHTTIPVPRVVDDFKYDGSVYIIQEFIDAPMLLTVWRKLGLDDRKRCMIQLKGYLEQLRSLASGRNQGTQVADSIYPWRFGSSQYPLGLRRMLSRRVRSRYHTFYKFPKFGRDNLPHLESVRFAFESLIRARLGPLIRGGYGMPGFYFKFGHGFTLIYSLCGLSLTSSVTNR